jgi:hypothetical protein
MSVTPLESFTPYTTVESMFTATPQWMSEYDAARIMSYQVYEQIYWNVPDTFKLTARGAEDKPIYIPTGRTIVDTTHRYVGNDFAAVADPDYGTPADQEGLRLALTRLFRREQFFTKYNSNKRFGHIRGDWLFHVIGNDLKPAGRRIKIEVVDPAAYFPVPHPDDPDRIIGCHIVEQIETEDGWKIKRQTYQKGADPVNNDGSDTTIYNSIATFDAESWEEFNAKPVTVIKPLTALHPLVLALPVYHVKNIESPGDPFGSSELRGHERIMAAINQAISDEELALALEGLGMYWTDAGPPLLEDGSEGDWVFGPGRVVEVPQGKNFARVTGVANLSPVMDHLKFLINSLKEASATPDIAIGKAEVSTASGVSLMLQMGPMLSKADEREEVIAGTMDQFLHDLTTMWLPGYEQEDHNAMVVSAFGDRLPQDRKAELEEITMIASMPGVADSDWIRARLGKLGFVFDAGIGAKALAEYAARAAALDPFAARMGSESEQDDQA